MIKRTPKRAACAAWISSVATYYDFFIYSLAATFIGMNFFPDADTSLLFLLSGFFLFITYVARPVGGIIFGTIGDIFGRRTATYLLLILIGLTTLLIAFLPTYIEAGLVGAYSLLVLNFLRGLFFGAEQAVVGTLVFEHSPDNRRGFFTSFVSSGASAGMLLATLVFILIMNLPIEVVRQWGWKIAFYLSSFVIVIGIVIRLTIDESPIFKNEYRKIKGFPLFYLLRYDWANLIRIVFIGIIVLIGSLLATFLINYGARFSDIPIDTSKTLIAVASIISIFVIPLWGLLSDFIGRKPVFLIGSVGSAILIWPFMWSINQGNMILIIVFSILLFSIVYNAAIGVATTLYAEMFSEKARVTGIALGTQLAYVISFTLNSLIQMFMLINGWVYYATMISIAMAVVSIVVMTLRETAFTPMEKLGYKNDIDKAEIFE